MRRAPALLAFALLLFSIPFVSAGLPGLTESAVQVPVQVGGKFLPVVVAVGHGLLSLRWVRLRFRPIRTLFAAILKASGHPAAMIVGLRH